MQPMNNFFPEKPGSKLHIYTVIASIHYINVSLIIIIPHPFTATCLLLNLEFSRLRNVSTTILIMTIWSLISISWDG